MSSIRKRIIGVVIVALMLIVCPIAVFATEAGQADAVAKNTTTAVTYDDVSEAVIEAAEGETIVLLNDAEAKVVSVTENVTVDLNGYVLKASYFTCFGNIVDKSDDNTGILKVEASRFLIQDSNAQLPVKGSEGYQFVDVTGFNKIFQDGKYMFQPFIEKSGHALIKDGKDASGVTINVRVSWEAENGKRSQIFEYKDEMVSQFLDSYYNNEDVEKYSKAFNLSLNGAEGISELTFNAVVISNTGVEFISEPVVVKNDNAGNSGDGEQGEGPLDPGTPDDPNEPGDDDIEGKPENPGDNTGGEGNEGGDTDDPTVEFPEDEDGKISGNISVDESNFITEDVELTKAGQSISAIVPAGVKVEEGTTKLVLTIKAKNNSDSDVETEEDEVLKPFDVHIEGIAADNTKPIIINMGEIMPVGMNIGNYTFYHVEGDETKEMTAVSSVDELNAHNQFYYDPATGNVTVCMTTFSEVVVVADEVAAWEGKFDYNWYDESKTELTIANADQLAAFGAIVGGMNGQTQDSFAGKTVKLVSDVNLGDKESENNPNLIFYPIGYYNNTEEGTYKKTSGGSVTSSVSSFEGTFDGNGHTVANFYQNTWEMFGDYNDGYSGTPNHYKDAMGLFGYVHGGIVKNLTVSNFSSDGEFTPTGIIAAYADGEAIFENIATTNCNPRVYNTGNGGIIGIAGDTRSKNDDHIALKNITVDNSNKISALWGSWDVACGGLVGMYRGNVDSSGNATKDTISFENCHVSAIIDVYNDVCANYQYYAYRYSGMIIGSVRHNTKNDEGKTIPNMTGISATGCTVNYGDWNDYYYCEFEKNTIASYSEDYQFSRVPHYELNFTDSNGNGVVDADERASVTGCKHTHTAEENHQAVYLPFHQLFTGYSWGVSSIGLEKYSGIVTNLDITEGDQEESIVKFEKIPADNTSYMTDTTVKIGDLFKAKDNLDVAINTNAIMVSVTPIGDSTANGVYTANNEDWTKGILKFSGAGAAKITITDYQFCEPTVITVKIDATQKFETKFTDDFLYRVGNGNDVKLDSLFKVSAIKDDSGNIVDDSTKYTIDTATLNVNIENIKGSATGVYTKNESDWTQGTIQFNGTGVVTVTISEAGSIPYVLNLEVVDGYNVTAFGGDYPLKNRNSVLLNKIMIATNGTFWLENATLYGNGFEFDVTPAKDGDTTNGYIGGNYAVALKNAILDNVQIIGEVYTKYGAGAKDMYNYPTILTNGDSIIANSYVSNGSAAVRAQDGNLQIINSTLEGGIFANLDIRGGTVTLDNVITINQSRADGSSISNDKGVVGVGIAFYECNVNAKLIVKTDENGNPLLKQYNCMSENVNISDTTVSSLKSAVFNSKYSALQFTDTNEITWVNTGIMCATEGLLKDNISDIKGYTYQTATVVAKNGWVYTPVPTDEAVKDIPSPYTSKQQYVVLPNVTFNHEAEQNYKAPSEGSNEYCYFNTDTKQLEISFDEGKNKVYDPNILTAEKAGQTLDYTVKIDGEDKTGESITFDKAGTHTAVYTYTDPYNFRLNSTGEVETYSVTYEKEFAIAVSAVAAKAKDAKFTFYGYSSISTTAATTITDVKTATSNSGNLYIMPASTGTNVTSTTVDGITVNCPRVYVDFKDNTSDFNWLYPVFLGVKIEDYADGGTADTATTIVSPSSTSKPGNLTILTADKPSSGGGWSSGSGKSGSEGKLGSGTYKNLYGWTSGALGSDQKANSIYAQFTYKDNKGTTYYYVIEFYRAAHECPSTCFTSDTLISLADGTQKSIDELKFSDKILAWDFFTGDYVEKDISLLVNHGENIFDVVYTEYDGGTLLKTIGEHGVFDYDLNKFVYITADNVADYIGHRFVKQNLNGDYDIVTMTDGYVVNEYTEAWSISSAETSNAFASGLLTVAPPEDFYNWIEMDGKLQYDVEQFTKDVETYGLYTYEDFEDYVTYEQFVNWNGAYLKIPVEKGLFTFEYILELIDLYVSYMPE